MTAPQYLGAALCYDESRIRLYENACKTVNPLGNSYDTNQRQFNCYGILMYDFYLDLVAGGEPDQCICKFENTYSSPEWALVGHWGLCDGACVNGYHCSGGRPVLLSNMDPNFDDHASLLNETDSVASNLATPLKSGWKAVLCIATLILFKMVA